VAIVCTVFLLAAAGRVDAQFRVQPALPPPEDFHIQIAAMLWTPTPELTIDTEQLEDLTGSGVDFVKDFNIVNQRFTEWRIELKPGRKHKIRVSHVPVEYNASTILTKTITYKGRTFPATAPATTDIKWDLWRFGYEYDFALSPYGLAGFVTELKYNDVKGTITSTVGDAFAEQKAPVPTIGLILRGYVHKYVSVTGEFTGFKIPHVKNFDGRFWDFDLYATGSVTKYLGVQGGYRSVTAHYVVDDDTGDLKLKGPYFGGIVRF
jgi:hypothetical protein